MQTVTRTHTLYATEAGLGPDRPLEFFNFLENATGAHVHDTKLIQRTSTTILYLLPLS